MSSYTGGPHDDLLRNSETQGYDLILKLVRANMAITATERDQLLRNARKLSGQKHIHSVIAEVNSGIIEKNETVALKSQDAFRRIIPRYSKTYQILHDNTQAGGLTFPQTNRKFGGGAQSDGTVGIRLDSDDIQFTEYTVAFWLKMSLAVKFAGVRQYKCPIGFLNTQAYGMILQTNAARFNTNILGFDPNSHGDTANTMPYEFIPDVWQHHVLTAKDGEQCVYLDGVKVEFAAGLGQIPSIDITSKRAEIFNHFSRGGAPLFDGDKMAWLSICKGIADQTWVTNDYNGIRDFSDDSPVEEITTMPFDIDLMPMPNATEGLFQG